MTIQQIGAYVLAAFFVFAPTMAFAAEAGFVGQIWPTECNCEGMSPGFGCIVLVIDNLMKLAVAVGASATLFAFLYAGFLLIINAFNSDPKVDRIKEAKDLMWRAVIGLCIVLSAYVLVDFVMKAVYDEENWEAAGISGGNWNEGILITNPDLLCIEGRTNPPLNSGTPQNNNGQDNTDNTPDNPNDNTTVGEPCAGCTSLETENIGYRNGEYVQTGFLADLDALNQFKGIYVTEAYPPSRSHVAGCHSDGSCVDATFSSGSYSATDVTSFIRQASNLGMCAVFETTNSTLASSVNTALPSSVNGGALRLNLCTAANNTNCITGQHFSIYASPSLAGNCSMQ